jgi:release factor glutamine methyltransferase
MMRRGEMLALAAADLAAVSDSPRDEPLPESATVTFRQLLARRRAGEPVAYLTGYREFWSLPLQVNAAVLVPRPDTETLVEQALAAIPATADFAILDLGTGSGAIALALASERPRARVTATDRSPEALDVARANAVALGLERVRFVQGDWFAAVPGERFEVIVCNPPYVAAADPHLRHLGAEPLAALSPGPSGLEAYAVIVPAAAAHLAPHGRLLLEHGADQAHDVKNLLECNGFHDVTSHPDLSGTLRVTQGSLSSHSQRPS